TSSVHKSIQYTQQRSIHINSRFSVDPIKVEPGTFPGKFIRHPEFSAIPKALIVLASIYLMNVIPKIRILLDTRLHISRKYSTRHNSFNPVDSLVSHFHHG